MHSSLDPLHFSVQAAQNDAELFLRGEEQNMSEWWRSLKTLITSSGLDVLEDAENIPY